MTLSAAALGYTTLFSVEDAWASAIFVDFSDVTGLTPPNAQVDEVDVTHMQSPARTKEFVAGLTDLGEIEVDLNYVPSSVQDAFILAWRSSGERRTCTITYEMPDGGVVIDSFPAFVLNYAPSLPVEDRATAILRLKVAGQVLRTRPSLMERLLALPGLAAAYTTRDATSFYQSTTGGDLAKSGLAAGLVIDKHLLGSQTVAEYLDAQPELLPNSDVAPNWTVKGLSNGSLSVVGGKLRFHVTATNWAYRSFATTIGTWYRLVGVAEAVGTASSFYTIRKGDTDQATVNAVNLGGNSALQGSLLFQATATTTYIVLQINSTATDYDVDFSGIGIKAVPGNHAVSDATGHRPVVKSGRYFDFDGVDDVLYAQIAANLGSACSVYYYTQAGEHVWQHGLTINAGAYALSTTDWVAAAIFSELPTAQGLVQAWGVAQITPPLPNGWLSVDATLANNVMQTLAFDGQDATGVLITDVDGYRVEGSSNLPEFYATKACTVTLEYELNSDYVGHPPGGEPFGWFSEHPNEWAAIVNTGGLPDSAAIYHRMNQLTAQATPQYNHPTDGANPEKKARRRVTIALQEGQQARALADNFMPRTEAIGGPVPDMGAPTRMTFLKSARFTSPTRPLVNGKLHKVQIRVGALSNAEMEALHLANTAAPALHMLGDSFVNGGLLMEAVMENFAATDNGYVPFSYDAEGGKGLTVHAGRIEAYATNGYTKWWDSTLVVMEGGPDDDPAASVAAMERIVACLTHDRWVFVESSPRDDIPGSANRDIYDAKMAALYDFCGPDRWIPTVVPLANTDPMAGTVYHDGSANDLADCANLIMPRSLRLDIIHPTQRRPDANSAGWWGNGALGQVIYNGLVQLGHLP